VAYTFDNLFAADPSNPTNVASNASILLYDPADPTKTPVTITDPTGSPIPNPVTVNKNGFGPAMQHATLDRLAWEGGGFSNFITSYEGMKNEAVSARTAAQEAAATAGADAAAVADAAIGTATDEATAAAAAAEAAAEAADASALAAANSAALVGAPADNAIATAINATGSATKTALSATYAPASGSANYAAAAAPKQAVAKYDWVTNYVREAFLPPNPDDMPTITYATQGQTTALTSPAVYRPAICGTGSQTRNWDGASDTNFRWASGSFYCGNGGNNDLALYGELKPGGAAQAASWPIMGTFVTQSTNSVVEFGFYTPVTTDTPMFRVNGKWVTEKNIIRTVTGNDYKLTLTFPTAKSRTITIVGSGTLGLLAVRVPTGQTISKPSGTIKRRVAIIGDSYVNGAGGGGSEGANNIESFAPRLAHLMGADDTLLAGIGGTGWVAGMDGATPNPFSTRTSFVSGRTPHAIVFYGSINDGSGAGSIQAAVESTLQSVASVPEVYVIGPAMSGYAGNAAAVKAGTLAKGRVYIDADDFIFGTGRIDNPKGDGNRDFYLMTDGAHPTFAAHKGLAEHAFRGIYTRNQ